MAKSVIKYEWDFKYRRILTADDDLDDINEVGMYQIRGSGTIPKNAPTHITGSEQPWAILNVYSWSTGGVASQIYIRGTTYDCRIYGRYASGSPRTWSPWIQYTSKYPTSGTSRTIQTVFFGKGTNDLSSVYGSIVLPDDSTGKTVSISITNTYGTWFSDGKSHTLDLTNSSITNGLDTYGNIIWVTIPVSNITSVGTVCWIRLHMTYKLT